METISIGILNPRVKRILKKLVDLKLIEMKTEVKSDFFETVQKLRTNAKEILTLDEINKEVEMIRNNRYEA